jgi:hypothetical protein
MPTNSSYKETDYLAGLWRSTLPRSLFWAIRDTPNIKRYRFPYCSSPSWSWASVSGNVYWLEESEKDVKVLEASTNPVADPFGQVNGGVIRLAGRLFHVSLISPQYNKIRAILEWEYVIPNESSLFKRTLFVRTNFDDAALDGTNIPGTYFAPIACSSFDRSTIGLLLEKVGYKKGTFRHIGAFMSFLSVDACVDAQRQHRMGPDNYLDFDGKDVYTFDII